MKNCAVLGGGSWGTAISVLLARQDHNVRLYTRSASRAREINEERVNTGYFPEIKLPEGIQAGSDPKFCLADADYVFISVPTEATSQILSTIEGYLSGSEIIISTAKGIDTDKFKTNFEIINNYLPNTTSVLSGPTHAEEVIKNMPTAAVVAARNSSIAGELQRLVSDDRFRVYRNQDVRGVELGGAVKNVMAIAAGISDGLEYGDNARASLVTRGLAEIRRIGAAFGAKSKTFNGLSGLGDLIVTAGSTHSRNRTFGYKIGCGFTVEDALDEVGQVVEGVKTTRALYNFNSERSSSVEMPITNQVFKVIFNGKNPERAVDELMMREYKSE
ncbi:NAD(P)H-dependent glycerol-3-phosphate dehydrogenase [Halarsenatibacter silvermanii]|uniref:Glycerol-3-phosphate dehydrogenase [NAD(P)+] n=1 Tax=Halarsenatibacter silvermanii TaxID=321763 RepID=A0A1G9NV74_9FIRM|nr:NAD(P)H-dependent glycerol-3-phosphate dehydrogenase [Halarsenatibacter silvermanii]SDL90274.1 glycerol 3-phosphate dehydrogenase (NAD(P)+) [Halarsenatibacter silvermanii]